MTNAPLYVVFSLTPAEYMAVYEDGTQEFVWEFVGMIGVASDLDHARRLAEQANADGLPMTPFSMHPDQVTNPGLYVMQSRIDDTVFSTCIMPVPLNVYVGKDRP